jgi:hypothetical protein
MFFDLPLEEYIQFTASMLDVPVYLKRGGRKADAAKSASEQSAGIAHVEAVHALFTLFLEFRNSQHFSLLSRSLV